MCTYGLYAYMYIVRECMHIWSPECSTLFYIEPVSLRQTQVSLLPLV